MTRPARSFIAMTLFCVAVAGCSVGEQSRSAATGKVTMDGAPAPFVIVSFLPTDSKSLAGGSGHTDEAGKFTIGQGGKNTGLPAGDYKVTFSQTLVKGKPTLAGSGGKAREKDKTEKEAVADEYRDREKTPVTATIGSGSNDFTFDIKAKK
jgi:hypothetical protein